MISGCPFLSPGHDSRFLDAWDPRPRAMRGRRRPPRGIFARLGKPPRVLVGERALPRRRHSDPPLRLTLPVKRVPGKRPADGPRRALRDIKSTIVDFNVAFEGARLAIGGRRGGRRSATTERVRGEFFPSFRSGSGLGYLEGEEFLFPSGVGDRHLLGVARLLEEAVDEYAGIADFGGRGLAEFERIERRKVVAPEQLDIEALPPPARPSPFCSRPPEP